MPTVVREKRLRPRSPAAFVVVWTRWCFPQCKRLPKTKPTKANQTKPKPCLILRNLSFDMILKGHGREAGRRRERAAGGVEGGKLQAGSLASGMCWSQYQTRAWIALSAAMVVTCCVLAWSAALFCSLLFPVLFMRFCRDDFVLFTLEQEQEQRRSRVSVPAKDALVSLPSTGKSRKVCKFIQFFPRMFCVLCFVCFCLMTTLLLLLRCDGDVL